MFESPWVSSPVYWYLFAIPCVFLTLVNLQKMFDVRPDPIVIARYRGGADGKVLGRFYPVRGSRTFYRYLLPFIFYVFFLTFTVYLFIPWMQNGMAHFQYKSASLFSALLGWIFLSPVAIVIILRNFFIASAFLEIYPEHLVVRKRTTTWYIPVEELDRIIFYTRGGSSSVLNIWMKNGTNIWFSLDYLKKRTVEIRECLVKLKTVDLKSGVLKKTPVSVSMINRSRTAPGATGWSRVSRFG